MSTSWGYYCRTCDTGETFDGCGGTSSPEGYSAERLRVLVQEFPVILPVMRLESVGNFDTFIRWPEPFVWLADHAGHEVELLNGYGQRFPLPDTK